MTLEEKVANDCPCCIRFVCNIELHPVPLPVYACEEDSIEDLLYYGVAKEHQINFSYLASVHIGCCSGNPRKLLSPWKVNDCLKRYPNDFYSGCDIWVTLEK